MVVMRIGMPASFLWVLGLSLTQQLDDSLPLKKQKKLIHDYETRGIVCNGLGAKFHIGNVIVHLDEADVVAMNFKRNVNNFNTNNNLKNDEYDSEITRCGKSNQIAKNFVTALDKSANVGGNLSDVEWVELRPKYGRSYGDELEKQIVNKFYTL